MPDDPAASGDPGWFVVFQEQPAEPRFGLDDEQRPAVTSWNDLAWPDVDTTAADHRGYLEVVATSSTHRLAEQQLVPAWDGRADSLAAILLRRAFRLFVHASDLVPE